ncbi:MAG: peptidoglycan editing factor PgeF [Pseudomonadota bacterium]
MLPSAVLPSEYLLPLWPDAPPNVGALASTRRGGVSAGPYGDGAAAGGLNLGEHVGDDPACVANNRARLQTLLPGRPLWLAQVHGVAVVDASAPTSSSAPVADASFSTTPAAVCAILTADCLPVLLADAQGRVVGAAHAGWRGLAGGVLARTVDAMRGAGAGDIVAWLGPAIGPHKFEVGTDVLDGFLGNAATAAEAAQLRAAFAALPGQAGKYLADLYALARCLLAREGVTRVSGGQYCTASEPDRFYSYRRDGISGRQASLIWLK